MEDGGYWIFVFLSFYDHFLLFAVCWPAGSTLVAVEPRAFETMSKALTRNTNCHPFKDATGAVFAVCRCIGLRQCRKICTVVPPASSKMGRRVLALLGSWTSKLTYVMIEKHWRRLQVLLRWAAASRWLSTQALVAAWDIFHVGASNCFSHILQYSQYNHGAPVIFSLCRSNDTAGILHYNYIVYTIFTSPWVFGIRDVYARSTEQPKWSIVWSLHNLGALRLWSSPVRRQQVEKKCPEAGVDWMYRIQFWICLFEKRQPEANACACLRRISDIIWQLTQLRHFEIPLHSGNSDITWYNLVWPGTLAVTGKIGAMWQPWLKMFEGSHGSHGSHGSPHSAMEWLGSALSPVSPDADGSDVPYGYGARRPGSSSFLVKNVEHPWPWWNMCAAQRKHELKKRLKRCWLHCRDTPQKIAALL